MCNRIHSLLLGVVQRHGAEPHRRPPKNARGSTISCRKAQPGRGRTRHPPSSPTLRKQTPGQVLTASGGHPRLQCCHCNVHTVLHAEGRLRPSAHQAPRHRILTVICALYLASHERLPTSLVTAGCAHTPRFLATLQQTSASSCPAKGQPWCLSRHDADYRLQDSFLSSKQNGVGETGPVQSEWSRSLWDMAGKFRFFTYISAAVHVVMCRWHLTVVPHQDICRYEKNPLHQLNITSRLRTTPHLATCATSHGISPNQWQHIREV